VELIGFVEATFGVKLEDEQIFSDAFTTIDGISGVVHECLVAEAGGRRAARAAGN
jgi:acyl carrier protein